ncbi:hypothetical protein FHG87_019973 [Trinorchestia longiramus]|nr:hypothetical protein FHG87_019973 [Trinorchestia longiramus]
MRHLHILNNILVDIVRYELNQKIASFSVNSKAVIEISDIVREKQASTQHGALLERENRREKEREKENENERMKKREGENERERERTREKMRMRERMRAS